MTQPASRPQNPSVLSLLSVFSVLSPFSNRWKNRQNFFQLLEKSTPVFPTIGKNPPRFSNRWKNALPLLSALLLASACRSFHPGELHVPASDLWSASATASAPGSSPDNALNPFLNAAWHAAPNPDASNPSFTLDLSRTVLLSGLSLLWDPPVPESFTASVSLDGTNWSRVVSVADSPTDWNLLAFESVRARYLRLDDVPPDAVLRHIRPLGIWDQPEFYADGVKDPSARVLLSPSPDAFWPQKSSTNPPPVLTLDLRRPSILGSIRVDWAPRSAPARVEAAISPSASGDDFTPFDSVAPAGDFTLLMAERPAFARRVRLSFSPSSPTNPVALSALYLRGESGISTPWNLFAAAAKSSVPDAFPPAINRAHAPWSATPSRARLSQNLAISADALSAALRPVLVSSNSIRSPAFHASNRLEIAEGSAPLPLASASFPDGLSLSARAISRPDSPSVGAWFRFSLSNSAPEPRSGALAFLSLPVSVTASDDPATFRPAYRIRFSSSPSRAFPASLDVNGASAFSLRCVSSPSLLPSALACVVGKKDFPAAILSFPTSRTARAQSPDGLAVGAWSLPYDLPPGASLQLEILAGPDPDPKSDPLFRAFDEAAARQTADWLARTASPAFSVSRADVADSFRAQTAWLLSDPRPAVFPSDASRRILALLCTGHPDDANEALRAAAAALPPFDPNLLPEAAAAPLGDFARALWETYRFTRQRAPLQEHYPLLRDRLLQLRQARIHRSDDVPSPVSRFFRRIFFLSPPPPDTSRQSRASAPYDDRLRSLAAWLRAKDIASTLELPDDSALFEDEIRALSEPLSRSLRAAVSRMPSPAVPRSPDSPVPDPRAAASILCLEGLAPFAPTYEAASALDYYFDSFLDRYSGATPASSSPDELLYILPLALSGRVPEAREVLSWFLLRQSPPSARAWPDIIPSDPSAPSLLLSLPSTRAAAAAILAFRSLVVHENGTSIDLLPACPPEWLTEGDGLSALDLPTAYGPISIQARWTNDLLSVSLSGSCSPPGGFRLFWPIPGSPPDHLLLDGAVSTNFTPAGVHLSPAPLHSLEATFPFPPPSPRLSP